MKKQFYKALEDRFRGSRELIKSRLLVYLPFIKPLKIIQATNIQAIDLGCGRGEWLELLKEAGFVAEGVDLDDEMLEACRKLNLTVKISDAVSFLKSLPNQSQFVVSAFHLVEHIPFSDVHDLVLESLRVLKPGGILILETPNPENILVGSCSFYLDPTHVRPIPPSLLAFLVEYYGFARVKILHLHAPNSPIHDSSNDLLSVLNYVSPDYAIVAQKFAGDNILNLTNEAFHIEDGPSLEILKNWDLVPSAKSSKIFTPQQNYLNYLRENIKLLQSEREELVAKSQQQTLHYEAEIFQIRTLINNIYQSISWKITFPLRYLKSSYMLLKRLVKSLIKKILIFLASFIKRYPTLKKIVSYSLRKNTLITRKFKQYLYTHNIIFANSFTPISLDNVNIDLGEHAQKIYNQLKLVSIVRKRESL